MALVCVLIASVHASNPEGQAYLDANAAKEGVVVRESGLQYRVLQASTNASGLRPRKDDRVHVHYTGSLVNGTVFDSSRSRGSHASFLTGRVVKGWSEALRLMKEGDHWELVLPSELGYGKRGMGKRIPPGEVLIFDVELIAVVE